MYLVVLGCFSYCFKDIAMTTNGWIIWLQLCINWTWVTFELPPFIWASCEKKFVAVLAVEQPYSVIPLKKLFFLNVKKICKSVHHLYLCQHKLLKNIHQIIIIHIEHHRNYQFYFIHASLDKLHLPSLSKV